MKTLTISIPVYNDGNTIAQLIEEIFSLKNKLPLFKILIINDGSSDNTLKVVKNLKEIYPDIEIANHSINLGFGSTIAEVVKLPDTEWIVFLSGDYQFPAKNILTLWNEKQNVDFILGVRKERKDSWNRKINSIIYNKIIELFSRRKVEDINSIFLCKSTIFKNIEFKSKSAFIHAEIIIRTIRRGNAFKTIKIEHQPRKHGKGSGGKLRIIIPTVIDLLRFILRGKNYL